MALIFNTTNEPQSVRVVGNWFTFKPKQIKSMQDNIASFIAMERKQFGLVALPESFEDPEYRGSTEGKAELEKFEQDGINAYITHHRQIIYNNQVSLKQDLEKSNNKIDPASLAFDAELESMRLVAKYQKQKDDRDQKRIDEVKELMKSVGPVSK